MVLFDGPNSLFNGFSGDILVRLGSNYFTNVTDGEWWRLFSAGFLHANFMHLASNMLGIYIFGRLVENFFGAKKFIIIYLGSILIGNALSYAMLTPHGVGSSTGVFGLLGIHLYLFILNRDAYLKSFGKDIFVLIVINIFISIAYPSIDLWGHVGGLLGGFTLAFALGHRHDNAINIKKIAAAIMAVIIFFGLCGVGYYRNTESFDYHIYKWQQYHEEENFEGAKQELIRSYEIDPSNINQEEYKQIIEYYDYQIAN